MNIALWPRDSIARRFALTVALTVAATWSLVGLFFVFGGVWAQPSLERSGLLDQAASMVHIIEAAPHLRLMDIPARKSFEWSRNAAPKETKQARISYVRDTELVQQVKERLQVKSNKEAGEKTFDYYVEAEGLNGK